MNGLGDNIFQRPFVKSLLKDGHKVWITTPWPELYEDLDVNFVKSDTKLRTQSKNQLLQDQSIWSKWPNDAVVTRVRYGASDLTKLSILETMCREFGVEPSEMDLPKYESPLSGGYVVIRPVTARREWCNTARNPYPEYLEHAAKEIRKLGIRTVGVADLEDNEEWLVGDGPSVDEKFYRGELKVKELLGLVAGARAVIGGVGWILPTCIATKTPLLCVLGGNGGHNHPSRVTDRRMSLGRLRWAIPDRFCMCTSMSHKCDKTISNFDWSLNHFIKSFLSS